MTIPLELICKILRYLKLEEEIVKQILPKHYKSCITFIVYSPKIPNDITEYVYLIEFNVSCRMLGFIPKLPPNLEILHCDYNDLDQLPELPTTLKILNCGCNNLTSLPDLPLTLESLQCICNNLTSLPQLPPNLKYLNAEGNLLKI